MNKVPKKSLILKNCHLQKIPNPIFCNHLNHNHSTFPWSTFDKKIPKDFTEKKKPQQKKNGQKEPPTCTKTKNPYHYSISETLSHSLLTASWLSVTYHPASFIIKVLIRKELHPSYPDSTYPHFFLHQCKIQTQKARAASLVCAFLYSQSEAILLLFVLQVNNR